ALMTRQATSQNFFPEWLITGWGTSDVTLAGQLNDQQQWSHAFGLGVVQIEASNALEREREAQYRWEWNHDPPNDATMGEMYLFAHEAVSGLQLAGPPSPPRAFRAAMSKLRPTAEGGCR